MSNQTPETRIGLSFVLLALAALLAGVLFGMIGGIQFVYPEFLQQLPFHKARPLHVSLVVGWIFLAAIGGIYYYLPKYCGLKLYSPTAAGWHFWMIVVTGLAILVSYLLGRFGGREYWAAGAAHIRDLGNLRNQLLQDLAHSARSMARVLLDVGHRHHLLSDHFFRVLSLADSLFQGKYGP